MPGIDTIMPILCYDIELQSIHRVRFLNGFRTSFTNDSVMQNYVHKTQVLKHGISLRPRNK